MLFKTKETKMIFIFTLLHLLPKCVSLNDGITFPHEDINKQSKYKLH